MNYLNDLAKLLDKYYLKLPAFPKDVKDFIVSVSPWLALIFGVLAILSGVSAFGTVSVLSPFATLAGVHAFGFIAIISTVILLIQGVIELLAFSPLKSRKVKGWNLLYYSLVLSVVSPVISLEIYSILSSIILALIGYYFLYQIKSYYK
jgi:hypothetical protein